MKKTTGKVLSLVLSLALVLTSFPAMFASASTKSATGTVDDTDKDDIYMVNGGTDDAAKKSAELNDWIEEKVQTSTREDVDDVKVYAISHVSGDRLVSLKLENDDDDAYLKLRGKDVKGTEVLSVLYKGTYTDDDDNEYTIKARKQFTVHVYDENAPILGKVKDSGDVTKTPGSGVTDADPAGKGFDDFETLPKTMNTVRNVGLYLAVRAGTNAMAVYDPIYVTTDEKGITVGNDGSAITVKDSNEGSAKSAGLSWSGKNDTTVLKDRAYYLEITDGSKDVHYTDPMMTIQSGAKYKIGSDDDTIAKDTPSLFKLNTKDNPFKVIVGKSYNDKLNKYTQDASTSNVTFTLKKLKSDGSVSSDSDDKYTFKTKVEKKIDVAQAVANNNDGDLISTPSIFSKSAYDVKKADGKTRLDGVYDPHTYKSDSNSKNKYLDVTDCELVFPDSTSSVNIGDDDDSVNVKKISGTVGNLVIAEKANVGSIDIDGGTVEVSGKVGDITTDDDTVPSSITSGNGSVEVKSEGKTGSIDTCDADGSEEGEVNITGGTTGNITTKSKVTVDGDDSDDSIVTGVITAVDADIYSDEAKTTVAGIKAKDDDGTLDIQGNDLTIKSIDLDSRNTTLQVGDDDDDDKAYKGTLPEIKNAANATIKTENENTSAIVTSDLDVDTLDLDSDTQLTFSGKVNADTIEGDGVIVIPAGKLYVGSSVSGTKLKFSDANIAVGTTAFTAKTGEVDTDDFDCYGFTLDKTEGTSTDTFKIATVVFKGLSVSKTSDEIAKGYSATYTAVPYPGGTTMPSGYTVEWSIDNGDDSIFELTTNANGSATVKCIDYDTDFASNNKATLKATLIDADGDEVDEDDYCSGECALTALETPKVTHISDTTKNFSLAQGASYQFKITSSDGSEPAFGVGSGSLKVAKVGKSGNAYYYKITAVGKTGDQVGVYLDKARLLVVTIKPSTITLDTGSTLKVAKGKTYQFKATSSTAVAATSGNSKVFQVVKSTKNGNNTYVTVKAVGSKGQSTGIYFNGVRRTVATVA